VNRASPPPSGFEPHARPSPFLDLIGPLWSRRTDAGLEFALVIDERHVNARGSAHGGVLAALADVSLGYATAVSQDPPVRLTTAALTIDFAGAVETGQTVIATVDVQRVGRRLAFANCYLHTNGRRVVRASAVFANAGQPPDSSA
jgi:acyl-coenzyme A thioesterase 13